jgi:hypothetical protein
MTVHILKLAVGAESVDSLEAWQAGRLAAFGEIVHQTRVAPKRRDEVRDGGSLYWVIKGQVRVRQPILNLRAETDEHGRACCGIVLDPAVVLTRLQPRRPFQGWRYLEADDAPADWDRKAQGSVPPELHSELAALGLL